MSGSPTRTNALRPLPRASSRVNRWWWTGSRDCAPVRERVETKSGVCTKARIAPNPTMQDMAERLARGYGLRTPFCFQAMSDGAARLAVTDINPRLGAGTLMSAANGGDFFGAHLASVFGMPVGDRLQRHHERCSVTRQYVELLTATE